MATLAYKLRIRDASDSSDDLVVTSLDAASLDGEVTEHADDFAGYADTPALLAAWSLFAGDQAGSTLTLDPTGGVSGGKCAKLVGVAGNTTGLHRGSLGTLLITGLAPNTSYRITGKIRTDFDPVTGYAFGEGPVGIGSDGGVNTYITDPAFGTFKSLEAFGTSNGSGELTVYFGWGPHNGLTATRTIWFDDLVVSGPGVIANYPYIAEPPQGDGQTLNPITGEVQVGGFTVPVIDALIGTNTRVVTAKLADAAGKNALNSRRAYVEESEDGGDTWDVLMAGYVNSVRLVSAIRYEFTVGESRRVEQTTKVFQFAEPGFDRVSPILGGTLGDFGPYADRGRPRFKVVKIDGDVVTLKWLGGPLLPPPIHEDTPPIPVYNLTYINRQAQNYIDTTSRIGGFPTCPGLTARLMDINTGPGLTSNPPTGHTEAETDFMPLGFTEVFLARPAALGVLTDDGRIFLNWPVSRGNWLSVGDQFKLIVFPREISERNPLHWMGHPMDLVTGLLALRGESYNAASAAAVKAELGSGLQIEIRITAAMTLADALEKIVYGPFGVGARTNNAGEREFFTTRRDFVPPVETLTNDDLTSADGIVWATEEGSAINKVTFKTQAFTALPPGDPDPDPNNPLDWIGTSSVTVEAVPDESEGAVFGDHTASYELPGNIVGLTTGTPDNPGTLDEFVALIGFELFDFQGRGAITSEISVRRGVTDALIGETVTLDLAHLPTASPTQSPTSQRGTVPRIALVLRRTPTPSGPVLKLQDRGIAPSDQVELVPEFTIDKSTADPRKIVTVTITNGAALVAAGVKVRVQMATGSSTPTNGTSVRLLDPATDPLTFDLPAVCAGSKVWARMRSELTGFLPGDWSAFEGVQLDALDPPTSLAGTFTGQTIALSWVLGTNAADIPIEILLRETGDPDFVTVAILPPGTLSYELTVPDPDTEYDIGVRHHEAAPFDCVSATAVLSAETSGTVEDTPPPPPPPGLPPPLPPTTTSASSIILVPLHAALTHGSHLIELPAALTPLHDYSMRGVPAGNCARCRIQAHVTSALPTGAYLAAQYVARDNTSPAEEDWVYLDGVAGPTFPADVTTLVPTWSAWADLDLLARQDIVIRGVCVGGDGVTPLGLREMFVELDGEVPNDGGGDSTEPDPCQDSTIGFGGYIDTAAFEADWPLDDANSPDLPVAWAIDPTGGPDGGRALKCTISTPWRSGSVFSNLRSFLLTGLDPAVHYVVSAPIKTNFDTTNPFDDSDARFGIAVAPTLGPGIALAIATTPSFGQYAEVATPGPGVLPSAGGDLYIVVAATNGSSGGQKFVWVGLLTVTSENGEIVAPCSGGPTIGGPADPPVPNDPPPLPTAGSQRLILWDYMAPWTAFTPFNGTVFNVYVSRIIADLTAMRAAGMRAVITLVPHGRALRNGRLDLTTYMAYLETTAGLPLADYADVIVGIMVIDEPQCASCWGGASLQWSIVDGVLAKRTFELFPDYPRFVRASATLIERSGLIPRYITHAWNQWTNVYPGGDSARYATVQAYMEATKAAARRIGLGWMWAGNAAVGGPGGGSITPATIVRDYIPMAQDPEGMGLAVWAGQPPYSFLAGASYQAAFDQVVAAFPA